jgi:rod shape-determining protein MreC
MRSFIDFFAKYHVFALFLLLEGFSLFLTVRKSSMKTGVVMSSANAISGFFYDKVSKYGNYFNLKEENQKLTEENLKLKQKLQTAFSSSETGFRKGGDSTHNQYVYTSALVIKNSISYQDNYLTLDKGSSDGIEPDMVVISNEGAVGVIANVSNHFSTAVSVLNSKIGISCKLAKSEFFGTVSWSERDYQFADLNEIPNHVPLSVGDTVVTSSYSALFPENIPVGRIVDFKTKGEDNFYDIKIRLSVDFKNLRYVYIIKNLFRKERIELEEKTAKKK